MTLVLAPAVVLDVVAGPFGVGPAGFDVDDPGVADHLRVDVPVGHHQIANELEAVVKLLLRPARQVAVEPADASRVGHDCVLALDTVLVAVVRLLMRRRNPRPASHCERYLTTHSTGLTD